MKCLTGRAIRLGVLSDSELPAARLEEALKRMDLLPFFASVISSRDIGHCKPDREAYEAALGELACSPPASAFVGHDLVELAGAAQLGMHTIAFNYEPGTRADHYARHFSEIADIVTEVSLTTGK